MAAPHVAKITFATILILSWIRAIQFRIINSRFNNLDLSVHQIRNPDEPWFRFLALSDAHKQPGFVVVTNAGRRRINRVCLFGRAGPAGNDNDIGGIA